MSLMQLLTVGHSLSRPVEAPSPFRMVGPGWLPKFRSSEPLVGASKPTAGGLDRGKREGAPLVAEVRCRANPPQQQILPLADGLRPEAQKPMTTGSDLKPVALASKPQGKACGRWSLPVDTTKEWPRRAPLAARTALGSAPEIKVARNDLADEDLALVPVRAQAGGAKKDGELRVAEGIKSRTWSSLIIRLLHAGARGRP
jgi:hypothetical protein